MNFDIEIFDFDNNLENLYFHFYILLFVVEIFHSEFLVDKNYNFDYLFDMNLMVVLKNLFSLDFDIIVEILNLFDLDFDFDKDLKIEIKNYFDFYMVLYFFEVKYYLKDYLFVLFLYLNLYLIHYYFNIINL